MEEFVQFLKQWGISDEIAEKFALQAQSCFSVDDEKTHALEMEICEIKEKFSQERKKLKTEILELKIDSALDREILKAGGRNTKAIKALIDRENLSLSENGELLGLDLEEIMRTDAYLFKKTENFKEGTGFLKKNADESNFIESQFEKALRI